MDLVVVPALVDATGAVNDAAPAGDRRPRTKATGTWRSAAVVAFPRGPRVRVSEAGARERLDPVEKGLVIVVKNGRVLRRLTGQPPWSSLVGTMEVGDEVRHARRRLHEGRGRLQTRLMEIKFQVAGTARAGGSRRNATFGVSRKVERDGTADVRPFLCCGAGALRRFDADGAVAVRACS